VRSYYAQIRSLLRERPDLRPYLKRCRHCRILFFTDPRNAARDDLRCGFGCREAHRRACAAQRSAAFYREYPEKKRQQNRKRYLRSAQTRQDGATEAQVAASAPIVRHVGVILSLVERRRVGIEEVIALLAKKGRQHRMVRQRRGPYGGRRVEGRGS
jgi:hypothetical protein